MTKWFYRDPLAAAFMSKHFGMEFTAVADWCVHGLLAIIQDAEIRNGGQNRDKIRTDFNYYIHPNSVKLLEPQVLDVAQEMNKDDRKRVVQIASPVQASQISDEIKMGLGKIIQRNGKPFFWPESE